ncbi:MAG: hypothetical protein WDZ76_02975 [Pseudohongiellaceae bacterium]
MEILKGESIIACAKEDLIALSPDEQIAQLEQIENQKALVEQRVAVSGDTSAKVVLEISNPSQDSESRISSLEAYVESSPSDPIANLHFIYSCAASANSPVCNDEAVSRAIASANGNSVVWAAIAQLRVSQNDLSGAAVAMRNAASSNMFEDFYGAYLDNIRNHVPIEENEPTISRLEKTLSISNLANRFTGRNLLSLASFCSEAGSTDTDVANACIQFGSIAAEKSSTLVTKMAALALLAATHNALGNESESESFNIEATNLNKMVSDQSLHSAFNLMSFDDNLADSWFHMLTVEGEEVAMEYIVTEATALSQDPSYDPCPVN